MRGTKSLPGEQAVAAHGQNESTLSEYQNETSTDVDPDVLALLAQDDEDEDEDGDETEYFGMSAEDKLHLAASAADAVKAEDILALDVRGLTIITDYFLICTGKSSIQIRAIADRIEEKLREAGERKLRIEGRQEATWVLMDFSDVVIHILSAEQREFYQLEELWSGAGRVPLQLLPE